MKTNRSDLLGAAKFLGRAAPRYLFGRHRFWLEHEGVRLLISPRSVQTLTFLEVFVEKQYMPGGFDGDRQLAKNVVDLGANIGLFTAFALTRLATEKVVCVEMDRTNAGTIEKLIIANNWEKRVTCLGKAFYFENTNVGEVVSRYDWAHRLDVSGREIETITLPEIVGLFRGEKIDLLKVDIEGSEKFLLKEASRNVMSRFVRRAIIEAHPRLGCTPEEVAGYFASIDFECTVWRYPDWPLDGLGVHVVEARNRGLV